MIYTTADINEKQKFEELLDKTRDLVLKNLDSSINSGNKFESLVFNCMQVCADGTLFKGNLYRTADRDFPDIVINNYWGVEVKFTKDDKWKSIGNSVLESSRIERVKKIYMFFGKCGGIPDIKYRTYEDCLFGISVTHYPRYEIDMNLPKGESIFDLMNISYDELRNQEQPVKSIKKYYKSKLGKDNSLWWIDEESTFSRNFEIIDFTNLEKEQKRDLIAEGFILYPEVFNSNYSRLCAFWVSYYSIICPNMRDQYSAGGKKRIEDIDEKLKFILKALGVHELSKLHYNFLFKYIERIKHILNCIDLSLVSECWDTSLSNRYEMIRIWKEKIDKYTPQEFSIKLSNAFELVNDKLI